jgi:hypothetical protein
MVLVRVDQLVGLHKHLRLEMVLVSPPDSKLDLPGRDYLALMLILEFEVLDNQRSCP